MGGSDYVCSGLLRSFGVEEYLPRSPEVRSFPDIDSTLSRV